MKKGHTGQFPVFYEIVSLYNSLKYEIVRTSLLMLIGFFLLSPDLATRTMLMYSFGMSFFLVAMSQLSIKILFRSTDLSELAQEALKERNIAASIVFVAICLVQIALMYFFLVPLITK